MSGKFRPSAKAVSREITRLRAMKARRLRLICLALSLVVVAGTGLSVIFFARPVQVHGMSMEPTLRQGDVLLMDCVRTMPERGDVVVSRLTSVDGLWLVKRVVGLPGDEVTIDRETGRVRCNGDYLPEDYVKTLSFQPCDIEFPITVPDGHLFVLGDNRLTSVDSRSKEIGMVPVDSLIGRVWSSSRRLGGVE